MKCKCLFLGMLAGIALSGQSLAYPTFVSGVKCDGEFLSKTTEQRSAILALGEIFKTNNINTGASCLGWTNLGDGNVWFEASSDLEIFSANISSKKYLGGWPLTLWPHQFIYPENITRHQKYFGKYRGRVGYGLGKGDTALGCFAKAPLRYGDLENDTLKELVLFLGNDFIVFSPEREKIVFAEELTLNDWYSLKKTKEQTELAPEYQFEEKKVQYISPFMAGNRQGYVPGYRGYSKLYFGDFDNDKQYDILVWRKLYESRYKDDPVKGFKLIGEYWQHYERETGKDATGEYLPQETTEETIKNWLTAKNLTWQQGYPSKSECAGEEGKLIPEMHDTLLNDPDVLK